MVDGKAHTLRVRPLENGATHAFGVTIDPTQEIDPAAGPRFTVKQGQYLAYIHNYTELHRIPPAQADMQAYFRVSPPSVHNMVTSLVRNGLIETVPGKARSIRVLVAPEHLPKIRR